MVMSLRVCAELRAESVVPSGVGRRFDLVSLRVVVAHRILVVEDDAALARPLVRLLTRSGHEVEHADSCANARATNGTFDLGVFDVELPDGLGIDLGSDLLSSGTIRGVVFFTGTVDDALLKRASRVGLCVRKSEGAEPLLDTIRVALAHRARLASGSEDDTPLPCSPKKSGR